MFRSNSIDNNMSDHQSSVSQEADLIRDPIKKEETSSSVSTTTAVLSTKQPNIPSKKGRPASKKMNNNRGGRGKRSGATGADGGGGGVSTRSTRSSKMKDGKASSSAADSKRINSDFGDDSNEAAATGGSGADKNTDENDEPTIGHIKRDEEDHHAVTVIASLSDVFSLKQDMCLTCGSFGKDDEGALISCSQCGQSFHSYCAGLTNVII